MCKVIMIGCDLHDATTVLKVADGPDATVRKGFATSNRSAMIEWVKDFASQRGAARIVFAYEASGQGFGLYDDLTDAGIECHVLAPTHLPHTTHSRKNKTDDKDALMILDEVRAHVLAGRTLPDVWVPNHQTRDDREIVRLRLEVATQRTRLKNQIRNLAKRSRLAFPDDFTSSGDWSKRSVAWLREVATGKTGALRRGADRAGEPGGAVPGDVCANSGPRSGDQTPEPNGTLCPVLSQTETPFRSGDADGDGLPDGIGRFGAVRQSSAIGGLFGASPVGLRVGGAGRPQGAHHQARSGAGAARVVSGGLGGAAGLARMESEV